MGLTVLWGLGLVTSLRGEGIRIDYQSIAMDRFPRIALTVDVFDASGRALRGLTKGNFSAFENGRTCRPLDVSVDVTPISVVLVLDSSGSMVHAINHLKLAAGQFVRILDPKDEVMVIDFDNEPRVISPWSSDPKQLVTAIGTLDAYGATAFYDSVYKALLEVRPRKGRRAVVAMTDGKDQNEANTARLSRHTLREVVDLARGEKVPVHTIGLGKWIDREEVESLAKASGGTASFAPQGRELEQLYVNIARNLKSRVRIGFRSPMPRPDGSWRTVKIQCARGSLTGTAEERYRAPGRYALDLSGQGFERERVEELAKELPRIKVLDVELRPAATGGPEDLKQWVDGYFKR